MLDALEQSNVKNPDTSESAETKRNKKNKYQHLAGLNKDQKREFLKTGIVPDVSAKAISKVIYPNAQSNETHDLQSNTPTKRKKKKLKKDTGKEEMHSKIVKKSDETSPKLKINGRGTINKGSQDNDGNEDIVVVSPLSKKKENRDKTKTLKTSKSESSSPLNVATDVTSVSAKPKSLGKKKKQKTKGDIEDKQINTNKSGKKTKTGRKVSLQTSTPPFKISKLKRILEKSQSEELARASFVRSTEQVKQTKTTQIKKEKKPQSLREKMMEKLNSARFRYLNEQLYTQCSEEGLRLFEGDPEAFTVYHEGFQSQVTKWPVNPVDQVISYIQEK